MAKVVLVYGSTTGNTEALSEHVAVSDVFSKPAVVEEPAVPPLRTSGIAHRGKHEKRSGRQEWENDFQTPDYEERCARDFQKRPRYLVWPFVYVIVSVC